MSKVAVYKVAWRNTVTKSEGSGYVVTQISPEDPNFTDPKWLLEHPTFERPIPYQHTGGELIDILSFNQGFAVEDVEVVTREVVTAEAFDGREEVKFGDKPESVTPIHREKPVAIHESAGIDREPVIDAAPGTSEFATQTAQHDAWVKSKDALTPNQPASAITGQAVSNDVVVTETKPVATAPAATSFTPVVPAADPTKVGG
jgi:hypothetical protein